MNKNLVVSQVSLAELTPQIVHNKLTENSKSKDIWRYNFSIDYTIRGSIYMKNPPIQFEDIGASWPEKSRENTICAWWRSQYVRKGKILPMPRTLKDHLETFSKLAKTCDASWYSLVPACIGHPDKAAQKVFVMNLFFDVYL